MIPRPGTRLARIALVAVPLLASCSLDNQVLGVRGEPSGSTSTTSFRTYAAIGTSLAAGIQSGGINDSTQRETYTYQLAKAMGLTPGVDWFYPSFASWGCPPPYTDILANRRVGGQSGTFCGTRNPATAAPYMSNTGIPGLRAAQALDLTVTTFSSDTLKLAQFITGSVSPVNMVLRQRPTFVTIEVGANDVLAAATRGDTTFLTTVASFTASIGAIRDSLKTLGSVPNVAIANVPNVTVIPHFTKASTLFCLKTGACGIPATLPYSSPLFTVDASCAPNAGGGVGDNYLLAFPATGAITSVLAASRAAKIDCARDSALVAVAAAPAPATAPAGATINTAEYPVITARVTAFNSAVQALATAEGWAYVDLNAALQAQLANIPALPGFTTPTTLFGTLFSLDGIHPTKAGYKILAQTFATAINAKYGSALAIP